jgi:hypothetical protein
MFCTGTTIAYDNEVITMTGIVFTYLVRCANGEKGISVHDLTNSAIVAAVPRIISKMAIQSQTFQPRIAARITNPTMIRQQPPPPSDSTIAICTP